ncbi:MAG: helix-hairpin-helix domain-containing protein [Pseudohongiellaceae bacterium]
MNRMTLLQALLAAMLMALSPLSLAAQELQDTTEQVMRLDINKADAATIAAALDGVGMVKAEEIVAYREMFGSFTSVDELMDVNGIGAATVERNRHRILITSN